MSLGNFAGGVAEGFGKGVKLVNDADEVKRKKRKDAGIANSKELMAGIPELGTEAPAGWTSENYVNSALAKAKPQPTPIERIAQTIAHRLRPQDAAASAGIQTQPIQPPAPEGGAAPPAAGIPAPAGEVAPVEVEPPPPRKITDTDQTRIMIRAAVEREDHEEAAKLYEKLGSLQVRDLKYDVERASMRGMPGMANAMTKLFGMEVDYEPVPGTNKFKVTIDGEPHREATAEEFRDELIGLAGKDTEYARQASLTRDQGMRQEREIAQREAATKAQTEIARERLAAERAVNASIANKNNTSAEVDRTELAQAQGQLKMINDFQNRITDNEGAGDAFINADELARGASALAAAGKGNYNKVINGEDGQQQVVTGNYYKDIADNEILAANARFKNSPYTTMHPPAENGKFPEVPILGIKTIGGRKLYTVYGVNNGAFTNLDSAEQAARRMYPLPKK